MNAATRCLLEFGKSLADKREKLIIVETIKIANSSGRNANIIDELVARDFDRKLASRIVRQATKYGKKNLGIHAVAESTEELT